MVTTRRLLIAKKEMSASFRTVSYCILTQDVSIHYFSVRSSRLSALRYGWPSWMSVKTTWGGGGGKKRERSIFLTSLPPAYDTKMAASNGLRFRS